MTEAERKPYNTVYEKLVQRDDDLIGLIAYALYKQHKRDWLIAYRQREGREPSAAELSAYLMSQQLDRTVLMYRERAEAVLNQFGEQIIDRATPDIQRKCDFIGDQPFADLVASASGGHICGHCLFCFADTDRTGAALRWDRLFRYPFRYRQTVSEVEL